jgi:Flp pilus assembly protein TadD
MKPCRIRHACGACLLALLGVLGGCQLGPKPAGVSARKPTPHVPPAAEPRKPTTSEQTLDLQLALARTLEQQGDLPRAAELYQGISVQYPKDGTAVHRLAILEDRQGEFDRSAELFKKALKLQPGNADIFCDLGYSLYLQQRWAEAEMNLRQALALAPDHRRAHNHLGLVLAQEGRRDEAFAEVRKAGGTSAEAHMNLALVLSMNDRLEDAREEYEIALEEGAVPEELRVRLADLNREIARNGAPETRSSPVTLTGGEMPDPVRR